MTERGDDGMNSFAIRPSATCPPDTNAAIVRSAGRLFYNVNAYNAGLLWLDLMALVIVVNDGFVGFFGFGPQASGSMVLFLVVDITHYSGLVGT
jgi:hypothetical protein